MLNLKIVTDKKINAFVTDQLKKEINKMCVSKRTIRVKANVFEIECATAEKEIEFGKSLRKYLNELIARATLLEYELSYRAKIEKNMQVLYNEDGFFFTEDVKDAISVTVVKLFDGGTKAALINNKTGDTFTILLFKALL